MRKTVIAILVAAFVILDLAILPYVLTEQPDNVAGLCVAESTYNSATLTWEKTSSASKYVVYRSEEEEPYTEIATVKKTSFKDKNLTAGTAYKYKVKAKNLFKSSEKGTTTSVTPQLEKTPKAEAVVKKGKAEVTVKRIPGAAGYIFIRNDERVKNIIPGETKEEAKVWAGDDSVVIEKDAVTFVDDTAKPGEEQVYTVMAYSGDSELLSNEVSVTIVPAGVMTAEISDTDPGKAVVSWEAEDQYTSFKLYDGDRNLLTETDGHEYSFDVEEGDYEFRLVGIDDKGVESPPAIQSFKIEDVEMDNELARQAACDWAVKIANDDSFNYGTKGPANHAGCYFCGTQGYKQKIAKKKGIHRSFAKTYCCVTFVTAAFAHGAKDPYVYDVCSHRHTLEWLVGCNHISKCGKSKGYQNFRYLGHIPRDQLIPGDVLSSSNHAKIYIGDGLEAEATGGGWSSRSIRVEGLEYQGKFKVFRYVGSGSGNVLRITENAVAQDTPAKLDRLEQ